LKLAGTVGRRTDLGVLLDQRSPQPKTGRGERRHPPGGACADDNDVKVFAGAHEYPNFPIVRTGTLLQAYN